MESKFSVLMTIYKKTVPAELRESILSITTNQTVRPTEVIIVIDGPIDEELQAEVNKLKDEFNEIIIVPLAENVGQGLAAREGMKHCNYELIARMDSDDISISDRFEKQLKCFEEDAELSIVGSNIAEFIDSTENIVSYRKLPQSHKEICKYLKKRCPFNQVTVMFKKSEVEKAGGYLHWHFNEDSYLWARMYLSQCRFANLDDVLVFVRIDNNTFKRRGGWKYFKSEKDFLKFKRKNKIINYFEYINGVFVRFIIQVLFPNKLRESFFKWLRKKES